MRRFFLLLSCVGCFFGLFAQEPVTTTQVSDSAEWNVDGQKVLDSTLVVADTAKVPYDSLANPVPEGDIQTTINYSARDSMFFNLNNKELYLYGDAHVDYGDIQLESESITIDWNQRTIQANYELDSAGRPIGKPIFTDGPDVYQTDEILYNFKNRKAQIQGVITEQDGAFMHGDDVKKNKQNEMFIRGARYTTCNLADPHFFIHSKKLKVIPRNKVVSGPFHLRFREVPTPLWLPIGMFPQPNSKTSGFIMPVYGEERERGFFLRDGGYYWAVSDRFDLRLTGNIYSKGSNGLNLNSNYYFRYRFRGSFNVSYTNNVTGSFENESESQSYWLRWSHTPEARGNSRFSASVSAGSTSFNEDNNLVLSDFNRSQQAQFSSNVSYSTSFQNTPFSLSVNLRHNQNLQTEIVNLTLPEFTLNTNRVYPFKSLFNNSRSPLAELNFSHNFTVRNELTNAPNRSGFPFEVANDEFLREEVVPFDSENLPLILDNARVGGRHNLPISTSISFLKNFTVTPNLNYTELWYTRELRFTDYDQAAGGVRVDTVNGFSRAGSYRAGAGLSTILYGFYPFRGKKIQAIRHVVTPTVSFSYNPDFGDPSFGVYKDVVVDSLGTIQRLSKYQGFIFGSPPSGESKTMSFSLNNNIEMKVLDKKDSTGEGTKKIKIFDNLSLNTGYNFAADSFKLSNINWNARTSFFEGKLSINFSGAFDPYIYQLISDEGGSVVQRRLDRFAWNNGQGIGNLTRFATSINLNLRGGGAAAAGRDVNDLSQNSSVLDELGERQSASPDTREIIKNIQANPDEYVNFNLPWSLRASYTLNRSQTGFQSPNISKGLSFSGSLALTAKTQINFQSGYNFDLKEFTTTRISVSRDLHCWTLDFNWVPFGQFQSYSIVLRAKASILQDLKVQKRRSFLDFFQN